MSPCPATISTFPMGKETLDEWPEGEIKSMLYINIFSQVVILSFGLRLNYEAQLLEERVSRKHEGPC